MDLPICDDLNSRGCAILDRSWNVEKECHELNVHISAVKDLALRLSGPISERDSIMIKKQKQIIIENLNKFIYNNNMFLQYLQDCIQNEYTNEQMSNERSKIYKDITDAEDLHSQLQNILEHNESELLALKDGIDSNKNEAYLMANRESAIDSTKNKLEKQLSNKNTQCNTMAVQIRTLQSKIAESKIEMKRLKNILKNAGPNHTNKKECIKKAKNAQKSRSNELSECAQKKADELILRNEQVVGLQTELEKVISKIELKCEDQEECVKLNKSLTRSIKEYEKTFREEDYSFQLALKDINAKIIDTEDEIETKTCRINELKEVYRRHQDQIKDEKRNQDLILDQIECNFKENELSELNDNHENMTERDSNSSQNPQGNVNTVPNIENPAHIPKMQNVDYSSNDLEDIEQRILDAITRNTNLVKKINENNQLIEKTNSQYEEKCKEFNQLTYDVRTTFSNLDTFSEKKECMVQSSACNNDSIRLNDLEKQLKKLTSQVYCHRKEKSDSVKYLTNEINFVQDKIDLMDKQNERLCHYVKAIKNSASATFGETSF